MKRFVIIFLIAFAFHKANAQNFIPAYYGSKPNCGVNGFIDDTLTGRLLVYGEIVNNPCGLNYNYIAAYQNNIWSYLGPFDHEIFSAVIYNNELYACGWFDNVTGQAIPNLAKFNGSSWVSVPGFSTAVNPWRLKVINNELYLCGGVITTTNGSFNGVAKFNGSSWSGFGIPYLGDPGFYISDVCFYNNEMVIGGNFYLSNNDQDLEFFHNGQWTELGTGLSGSMGGVNKLEIYNGKLYIGGLIYKSEGNPGNMLLAWDGVNLTCVGDGLKDGPNSYGTATVNDMMVFKNKLFVSGIFNYAGNIFSCGLTIFDGNTFCSLDKNPQVSVGLGALGHYRDTVWIAGPQKYLTDSIKGIGKYIGNYTFDTCSYFYDVGIKNVSIETNFRVFPNPVNSILKINTDLNIKNAITTIYNEFGEIVQTSSFSKEIDVSSFCHGFYVLKIYCSNQLIVFKFFKE